MVPMELTEVIGKKSAKSKPCTQMYERELAEESKKLNNGIISYG